MNTENVLLIALLTFLAVNLGINIFSLIVINPLAENVNDAFKHSANSKVELEVLNSIDSLSSNFVTWLSGIILILAIALSLIDNLRTETYLLNIGLFSFILYFVLLLSNFIIKSERISFLSKFGFFLQNKIFILLNTVTLLVTYWSFLHYALNPKQ